MIEGRNGIEGKGRSREKRKEVKRTEKEEKMKGATEERYQCRSRRVEGEEGANSVKVGNNEGRQ